MKRLIVCCDGTWMDADSSVQDPSNVTRISRCFKRGCSDGTLQIINYESGVGTGSNQIDQFFGGAFGARLEERVREAYSFLCANYTNGDEIILIGFSRGAFTVRSVAGMIATFGLLTRTGMEHFYSIFKDMENWMNPTYVDKHPDRPFENKPRGQDAAKEYTRRLLEKKYTRVYAKGSQTEKIKVKAVAVWDTVGSLGVPTTAMMSRFNMQPANTQYQFYDTRLYPCIENAFQALALDEHRPPFSPAVWEMSDELKAEGKTNLRQVWFPGGHGNIGGGWEDQGIADITLAWMIDQLESIGVEFKHSAIDRMWEKSRTWQEANPTTTNFATASPSLVLENAPYRPWGLTQICRATNWVYNLAGSINRTPGLYHRVDPLTNRELKEFMRNTNEEIHSCVRVRKNCGGLGLDDKGPFECKALEKWSIHVEGGIAKWVYTPTPDDSWWSKIAFWQREQTPLAPPKLEMMEASMGKQELRLKELTAGKFDVVVFADVKM